MAKHVGIVACSAEGAALCYRTLCVEGQELLGRYGHPEVTMHTHPFSEYMTYIKAEDWKGVASLMVSSAEAVTRAGAEFAVCPDNTIHEAYDMVVERSSIPWLHIAEEVAKVAETRGFERLAILGTRYLMEGPVYPSRLTPRGISSTIPREDQRDRINTIIFEELVNGVFTEDSRVFFLDVIDEMKREGCDAVVLGCTEIPLIVSDEISSLPTLDSTRILARAALQESLG